MLNAGNETPEMYFQHAFCICKKILIPFLADSHNSASFLYPENLTGIQVE